MVLVLQIVVDLREFVKVILSWWQRLVEKEEFHVFLEHFQELKTVFGSGRFDAKSGYFGNDQPKGLFGSKQEFSECAGHESPGTTPRCTNKIRLFLRRRKRRFIF